MPGQLLRRARIYHILSDHIYNQDAPEKMQHRIKYKVHHMLQRYSYSILLLRTTGKEGPREEKVRKIHPPAARFLIKLIILRIKRQPFKRYLVEGSIETRLCTLRVM